MYRIRYKSLLLLNLLSSYICNIYLETTNQIEKCYIRMSFYFFRSLKDLICDLRKEFLLEFRKFCNYEILLKSNKN